MLGVKRAMEQIACQPNDDQPMFGLEFPPSPDVTVIRVAQVPDVKRAMELGKHAAAFVSTTFIRPVKLEFEKVSA